MPQKSVGPSDSSILVQKLANRPANPRKFTDTEQQIRDYLNKSTRDVFRTADDDFLTIPKPPYGAQPNVVGPSLAALYKMFQRLAPNLDNRTPQIQYGPGRSISGAMMDQNLDPTLIARTPLTLLGATNIKSGEINLNPMLGGRSYSPEINANYYPDEAPEDILGHELTHAAGYPNEKQPKEVQALVKKMMRENNGKR